MAKLNYPTTFKRLQESLQLALADLAILSGDVVGPSDSTWQDVAGTASCNLRHLASLLDNAREGNCESAIMFPSPSDVMDVVVDQVPTESKNWSVLCGNVGTVFDGSEELARVAFASYVDYSKAESGRCSGEDVTLFHGEEIAEEFIGSLSAANQD